MPCAPDNRRASCKQSELVKQASWSNPSPEESDSTPHPHPPHIPSGFILLAVACRLEKHTAAENMNTSMGLQCWTIQPT